MLLSLNLSRLIPQSDNDLQINHIFAKLSPFSIEFKLILKEEGLFSFCFDKQGMQIINDKKKFEFIRGNRNIIISHDEYFQKIHIPVQEKELIDLEINENINEKIDISLEKEFENHKSENYELFFSFFY